ncbi:YdiK family protein [Oceanobacillus senegalensis]|uniref:YdiK family protein n=1 Tax=Oceanobacillus senegalensis TaxID=1936063 RepID=UPI000A3084FA|nr:YdiK family protein [Oceanobacillus senegalensis]
MKVSLMHNAIFFFILGVIFIFIAIQTAGESVWSTSTVILAAVATFDIGVAIRSLRIHYRTKKRKKKE